MKPMAQNNKTDKVCSYINIASQPKNSFWIEPKNSNIKHIQFSLSHEWIVQVVLSSSSNVLKVQTLTDFYEKKKPMQTY